MDVSQRQWQISFGIVLMTMILMRLIWMDLREYSINIDPRVADSLESVTRDFCQQNLTEDKVSIELGSWESSHLFRRLLLHSCRSGQFSQGVYTRFNQGLIAFVVFFCALTTRFLTGRWLTSLVVALILTSRGRLMGSVELLSGQPMLMFLFSGWFCLLAHWLRSASFAIMLALMAWSSILVLVDWTAGCAVIGLLCSLCYLVVISRFSKIETDKSCDDRTFGKLLLSMDSTFLEWVSVKPRGVVILLVYLSAIVSYLAILWSKQPHFHYQASEWFHWWALPIDVDICFGLILLALSVFFKKAIMQASYWEFCVTLVLVIVAMSMGAYEVSGSLASLRAPEPLLWLEPVIITSSIITLWLISLKFKCLLSRRS